MLRQQKEVAFCELFLSQGIVPASNRPFRRSGDFNSAEIILREVKKKLRSGDRAS